MKCIHGLLLYVPICFFLLSCHNNQSVRQQLTELYGHTISVSLQNMVIFHNPLYNSVEITTDKVVKLVSFVDSTNCSECAIKSFAQWNPYLEYEDKHLVQFYFIVDLNGMSLQEIRQKYINSGLQHDIYIDTCGDFKKQNPCLPREQMFHTMLLDKNDKVVFVGNPVLNKKIKYLFDKVLLEQLSE